MQICIKVSCFIFFFICTYSTKPGYCYDIDQSHIRLN